MSNTPNISYAAGGEKLDDKMGEVSSSSAEIALRNRSRLLRGDEDGGGEDRDDKENKDGDAEGMAERRLTRSQARSQKKDDNGGCYVLYYTINYR